MSKKTEVNTATQAEDYVQSTPAAPAATSATAKTSFSPTPEQTPQLTTNQTQDNTAAVLTNSEQAKFVPGFTPAVSPENIAASATSASTGPAPGTVSVAPAVGFVASSAASTTESAEHKLSKSTSVIKSWHMKVVIILLAVILATSITGVVLQAVSMSSRSNINMGNMPSFTFDGNGNVSGDGSRYPGGTTGRNATTM
ncbi:MAG: hypothetical protein LBG97_07185 [Coriobacteriales bacterium]|nr:hypothetical protein [Coriobacteriales bacterium]